jgi:hypothetical protein
MLPDVSLADPKVGSRKNGAAIHQDLRDLPDIHTEDQQLEFHPYVYNLRKTGLATTTGKQR